MKANIKEIIIEAMKNIILPEIQEMKNEIKDLKCEFQGLKSEFNGLKSEFQGLRDKVDALNSKDELIRVLTEELKRRIFKDEK
jgi:archaellum component FlaC